MLCHKVVCVKEFCVAQSWRPGAGQKNKNPHTLGCASRFNLVGCTWTAHADFHTSYEDPCFSCRLCLASIDLGLPKPSFEASSMRHKNDMLTRCAQTTLTREENTPTTSAKAVPKCRISKKPMKWYAFYKPSWSSMDLYGTESTTRSFYPSKNPVCVPCEPVHRSTGALEDLTASLDFDEWTVENHFAIIKTSILGYTTSSNNPNILYCWLYKYLISYMLNPIIFLVYHHFRLNDRYIILPYHIWVVPSRPIISHDDIHIVGCISPLFTILYIYIYTRKLRCISLTWNNVIWG